MFGWGLTLLSTLVLAYVAWRASSVPWLTRRLARRTLWIWFIGLWGVMAGGRWMEHSTWFPGAALMELLGMTILGTIFLCFFPLLLVDLATGFGIWARPYAPRMRGWALLGGLTLTVFASIQGLREPEVVDYEVAMPSLPAERDGLVLVALSDFHLGALIGPRWLEARVAQTQALRPDLILVLGDIFEGHGRPDDRLIQLLRTLHAPLGVWGVEGNHERYGPTASPLDEADVHVLRNAMATPIPGLVLTGRTEAGHQITGDTAPLWTPPAERPEGALIMMSHIPNQTEDAARSGVRLMLSGHTHGGQIWPFGYLVGMAYPILDGATRINGMTLVVTRGTGTWGPRMRLWRRGEISRIRLRSI